MVSEISPTRATRSYWWSDTGIVATTIFADSVSGVPFSDTTLWYHFGPQLETRHVTDPTGAVVNSYRYDACGNTLSSAETWDNPFKYGGHVGYYTASLGYGLTLAGQRWYNPSVRRWMSRDPIRYEGGENLYEYVRENPVKWLDPTGLTAECPTTTIGCILEPERWVPYAGGRLGSCLFHCCARGYVENRGPSPEDPQAECFYDKHGYLISNDCRGTANDYPSSEYFNHTFKDRGGIYHKGRPALRKSLDHLMRSAN